MTITRASKIMASEITPNRRRGGDIRVLLGPATVGATSGFMGMLTLEPGEFVSEHYHPYSEEFLCLIRGELTVLVDGTPVRLSPGEALHIPIDVRHRVENTGDAQAMVVFHLSPLAPRPDLGHVDTEPQPNPAEPSLNVGEKR
ncbi:cupin domain-containing protein [Nonomuraea endophytica]|uniref:cupin domain-containing protein n=1 Tax=Nonomuraea endophytica TaxID=714136 RepID=UPI0037CB2731